MPIITIEDRIGLEQMLIKQLLMESGNPELRRAVPAEYAMTLILSEHSAEDIAISIIAVESSPLCTVASCANNIIPALGFIADHDRITESTAPFGKDERQKAREVYECYMKTKQARKLSALFGNIVALEYCVRDPNVIAQKIVRVFGGDINYTTPDNTIVFIGNLPWGRMKLMPLGDENVWQGTMITFATKMNSDSILDHLHEAGCVSHIRKCRDSVGFAILANYDDESTDRLDFMIDIEED